VGNPNTGKSCIFNRLTGLRAATANYPGTTVELHLGLASYEGAKLGLIDLPGIYGLTALQEDQQAARRVLLEVGFDVVVVVVDATNLRRNLYLALQLAAAGLPVVLCLNKVDQAQHLGLHIDHRRLAQLLGLPVVPTVAVRGEGLEELLQTVQQTARSPRKAAFKAGYTRPVRRALERLTALLEEVLPCLRLRAPAKAAAYLLLYLDPEYTALLEGLGGRGKRLLTDIRGVVAQASRELGRPVGLQLSLDLHRAAGRISSLVVSREETSAGLGGRLDRLTLHPAYGLPLMLAVFAALFAFIFYVGGLLEALLLGLWGGYVSPAFRGLLGLLALPQGVAALLDLGLNLGSEAIVGVMVPYLATFFLALSLIEDSGLLGRMAYLADTFSQRIGLSGRAIIPMLGGFGCNVPALMATRGLARRERHLLALLITMIPCSARTAVILGTVYYFIGGLHTLALYSLILALILLVGWLLHRLTPRRGLEGGLILEITRLQRPMLRPTLQKVWFRLWAFLRHAVPLLLVGSLIIAGLEVSGVLKWVVGPLTPLTTTLLGLPAVVIIPLLYGFIRKEGALVILVLVLGTSNLIRVLTPLQLFTFALVVSLYIPCLATVAILAREFGWRQAITITLGTFLIALAVGALFYHTNPLSL
jgi:ferrous iron transport protein B